MAIPTSFNNPAKFTDDMLFGNDKENLYQIANLSKEFGIKTDVKFNEDRFYSLNSFEPAYRVQPTIDFYHIESNKAYAMLACTKILSKIATHPDLHHRFKELYLMLQLSDNSIPRNPFM